ncbi:MAG: two-component system, NarL family, sensor kinase [Solirubrobacteraceae bacterium]|jgi:signal transduction histidine kinase|nr:two-component system, NarL family, sensor kinase [Solirubrobacteraceae bacterium]
MRLRRRSQKADRTGDTPPSVGAAVAKFAIGGLVATLILAVVGVLVLGRISRDDAIGNAKNLTALVGREVVQPTLSDSLLRGDKSARAKLDRVVRAHVLKGDILRIKVWSADGRILYSDRPELLGSRYALGQDEETVLSRGGVKADISDLSRPENRYERRAGKLLEVYLPIRTPGGRPVLFEAYLRFSAVAATGRDLWVKFLPALIGALIVLQLIQLPLARSLARRVARAHRDRAELLKRALDASELERRRIAADLHDGTVQELVAASYGLAAARERVGSEDPAAEALQRAEESCRTAVRELRSLLVEIYPPRLREAGLANALEDLVSPLERQGIRVSVESQPDLQLPDDITGLLYRTAREAVRNVHEHADARTLELRVAQENGRVSLSVADDGQGFAPEETLARPAEGHFGLRLLHDQVRDAGGTLEIDSTPGHGAKLRVEVPSS